LLSSTAWRRVVAVSFAALSLSFLFAGCGGGKSKPAEIVLWEIMDPEEREILDEFIARYNENHPDVVLSRTNFAPEQLRTQFLTAAMGGGGADLVFGPSDNAGPFSIAGIVHPIDELYPPSYREQFVPLGFDTLGGHTWMLPAQVGNHLCLICNANLVESPPRTFREMIEIAEAETKDTNGNGTPDQYGIVFESKEPFWLVPFLGAYGGWVMDAAYEPTLDTPAMVRALTFLSDLRNRYGVLPRECDYQIADTIFKEGKAAMTINGHWSWGGYDDAGIPITIASIPKNEETGLWAVPMISSRGYSVNANLEGERLEKVKEVLDYLVSKEVQVAFATRLSVIPSLRAAFDDPAVKDRERIAASWEQYKKGKRMPVVPEMRAIWDAMRPAFQNVLNGEMTPAEAAKAMQLDAERKIREMKG
jgi:maltose-binding protein MalE